MLSVNAMSGFGATVSVVVIPTTALVHHWLSDVGVK